jgi:hypothetical protein
MNYQCFRCKKIFDEEDIVMAYHKNKGILPYCKSCIKLKEKRDKNEYTDATF